jgi:UDP-N-acetylmuramoyl-tripeptide--D-alanyl-D-alanine ligase
LQPEHEIGVVELGMSHAGEIRDLAQIARPNMGVVTNVAPVHLGFFNSVAEIARAKYELVESLPSSATAVLNAGDEYVVQFGKDFKGKVVTFAIGRPADVRAENVEQRGTDGSVFDVIAGSRRERARLPLVGVHNVSNALAAIAVARENGIDLAPAVAALGTLAPADKRGQVMQLAGATVVNDCYNSNPKALISMVDALAGMQPGDDGRRIIVAGEMLELGSAGEQLHRRCGAHMAERGIDLVLGVRGLAQHIVEAAREGGAAAAFVPTSDEAGEWLAREVRPGDVVLLKASRGVRLEKALEVWQQLAAATAGQVHS